MKKNYSDYQSFKRKMKDFFQKYLVEIKKGCIFAIANKGKRVLKKNGPVVQSVRIHACHAWGREFESRPDRKKLS